MRRHGGKASSHLLAPCALASGNTSLVEQEPGEFERTGTCRLFTPLECARQQNFVDGYPLAVDNAVAYREVNNAMPVAFTTALLRCVAVAVTQAAASPCDAPPPSSQ